MKKTLKVLLSIILVIALLAVGFYLYLDQSLGKQVSEIGISDVTFAEIDDGTYIGEYGVGPVQVTSESTVENGKIIDIKFIKSEHGLGKKAESIVEKVIKEQKLDVDEVSGATLSSKVILKSIENALVKGE